MRLIRASALVLLMIGTASRAKAQGWGQWPPASGGGGSGGFVYIGALSGIPATCTVGQTAFITNATAGDNVYLCTATNTWTQQTGSSGTPPYVGTFTSTTATILASTHGQGVHPHVDVYSSSGDYTAAGVSCLTAGSAKVACSDSTSTGNVVITLGGSYTVEYVIYGGAGVGPAGAQGAGCGTLGGDLIGTCSNATVVDVNGAVVPASAAGTKTNSSRQLIAQTAADVVSEFSGGHASAAYGLATDGSQQLFGSGSGLTVGTTTISGGTNGNVEINNSGVLGELGTTGTGSVVRATSPALVTPALGTPASGNATNLTNLPITLTTTGSSGASTYTQSTNTLNIPQYSGGGGGATIANQLTDLTVTRTSNTVVTMLIPTGNTNLGVGSYAVSLAAGSPTITLSTGAATATSFWCYWGLSTTIACDTSGANFTGVAFVSPLAAGNSGASGFPNDVKPLFKLTAGATANTWDSFTTCLPSASTGCVDWRSFLSTNVVLTGTNMTSSISAGVKTIGFDQTSPLKALHFVGNSTPTVAAGGAIGTTPTISGTDFVGTVSVPSTAVTTGTIATVTFGAAYGTAPNCTVMQNGGIVSVGIGHGTPSTTAFTITAAIANVSAAAYLFDFVCSGN